MTHMTPGGGPPVTRPARAVSRLQASMDRNRLREAIAVRRQRLAEREADLVAACEKAVAHGAGRHIRLDDRTTWDRAAWNRYIDTATRLEPEFMPEMIRLIRDIERLERLPHSPRQSRRPQHERRTAETGKTEGCAEARRLRTVACPLGSMRGLNRFPSRSRIPASRPRRARAPVATGEAPSARAASVSTCSRSSRGARGRAVPRPVSVDRTRGNDAGTEPAAIPEGNN